MTAATGSDRDDAFLARCTRVVWALTLDDQDGLLMRAAERTGQSLGAWMESLTVDALADAAFGFGMVFDSYHHSPATSGQPGRHTWRLVLSRQDSEERDASGQGAPYVLLRLDSMLDALLYAATRTLPSARETLDSMVWSAEVDLAATWRVYLTDSVREDYADLTVPFEALFRNRMPEALLDERFEPVITTGLGTLGITEMCTYRLPVGPVAFAALDAPYLEIGMRPDTTMTSHPEWGEVAAQGVTEDTLLMPITRPEGATWVVRAVGYRRGAASEWSHTDPDHLVEAVMTTHERFWFPRWGARRESGR